MTLSLAAQRKRRRVTARGRLPTSLENGTVQIKTTLSADLAKRFETLLAIKRARAVDLMRALIIAELDRWCL